MLLVGDLDAGRAAAEAGDWPRARELLGALDAAGALEPADLDLLGWALLFGDSGDAAVAVWQRAFAGFTRAQDTRRAGLTAVHLATVYYARGTGTVGNAWLAQAEQRLDHDRDSVEYCWLEFLRANGYAESTEARVAALTRAEFLTEHSRKVGNTDTEYLGLLLQSQLLTRLGEPERAMALFDQVLAMSTAGLLGPFATAWTHCATVGTCTTVGDYQRAWDWSREIDRCAVGPPARADWPGDCQMHRAELMRVRGDWSAAEIALARVCEQVGGWHPGHAGVAYTELGLLSLRKGDLEAAETAFARAQEFGSQAQPGLAELALARGEVERAAESLRAALAVPLLDRPARAALLPTAVETALARGELSWARELADELDAFARVYSSPAHRACAAAAAARLAAATGDFATASAAGEKAVRLWTSVPAPYEAARAQIELATALLSAGDAAGHAAALSAAYEAFNRLGAARDARRAADLLGRPIASQRVDRALMFTDIEGSTTLLAELGDAAWITLLRRHDAQLRQSFLRHQGVEVHQKGGGDGFFVAFGSAAAALDCALDIQHRLRDWEAHPLAVRIGVHWATVTWADGDFSGRGVHEAARIAALANGGQILASTATLQAAGGAYRVGPTRRVQLRGLPGTAEIADLLAA